MKWMIEGIETELIHNDIPQMIEDIEKQLELQGKYIQYIEIDGEPCYNEYANHLSGSDIKEVNVYSTTPDVLKEELKATIDAYIKSALPEVQKLADAFYRTVEQETWDQFALFIDAIEWLQSAAQSLKLTTKDEGEAKYFSEIGSLLDSNVQELNLALERKDYILVGDLIKYEFIPLFEKFQV